MGYSGRKGHDQNTTASLHTRAAKFGYRQIGSVPSETVEKGKVRECVNFGVLNIIISDCGRVRLPCVRSLGEKRRGPEPRRSLREHAEDGIETYICDKSE